MSPAHRHPSLSLNAQNPLVEIGDEIEFVGPGNWILPGGDSITVPAGARATVVPWTIPGWPMGVAFMVEGHQHPQYQVFPMLTFAPKASRYPDKYRLLKRKTPTEETP